METIKPAKPTYAHNNHKKQRKWSTGSLQDAKRSLSEGARREARRRDISRECSTGSSAISLDVRCGCQYFQCDSLLPDRVSHMGTRPVSRVSTMSASRYVIHMK